MSESQVASQLQPPTDAKRFSAQDLERLRKVRMLILDVDGVLTDGKIFWVEGQGWTRVFHIHDGYGIRLLKKAGIQIAVMSGSDTADIRERLKVLQIELAFLGSEKKLESLSKLCELTGLSQDQMAFIGDDLFDLPVLRRVGFSATVPQAATGVREFVHYVTQAPAGQGAVREIAEAILEAQGVSLLELALEK